MSKHHDYDALPTNADAPTFKKELRVVGAVIIFIIILEIIARVIAPHLDYDRKNIYNFPADISKLEERAEQSGNPRVVFFGNSLMMHGLDEEIFHTELAAADGSPVETTKITPVGTAMLDWVYLYRRYFSEPDSTPDVLVVGFVRHHIHDQEPIKLRRLSRHFAAKNDLPILWNTDLHTFHEKVQSSLCNISALEGDQPEHQLGILYTMVPDYKPGVKANNRLVAAAKERHAKERVTSQANAAMPALTQATQIEPSETYERMTRFIEFCEARDVKIIFVPMPQPQVWDFNPEAAQLAKKHGMLVLDARRIPGMTDEDFSDGYHLGKTGTKKCSQWLAREMSKLEKNKGEEISPPSLKN